jgi:antitoxin CptB
MRMKATVNSSAAESHQSDPLRRARLRWRARRGLLENDLVLTRFLDRHEATLSDEDVGALTQLLELPDNDLMDLILARRELDVALDHAAAQRVVGLLRSV